SHRGRSDPTWRAKPPFLHDPQREIAVYREVIAPHRLPAPAFLGAVERPRRGRYWLFLELVEGDPLWQRGDLAAWERVAAALAAIHARFMGRTFSLPHRLVRHD